jgi:hypothetical protein
MWWRPASRSGCFSVTLCTARLALDSGSLGSARTASREVYLYHVVDNADTMREYGAQCVVWQTAINPGHRFGVARERHLVGRRRTRSRGLRCRTVPWNCSAVSTASPWGLTELSQGR